MEFRKVTNKAGEVLTTKEGKELMELRLEVGDEIIPLYNSVLEKKNEVEYEKDGKIEKKVITNYSIKCKARDETGAKVQQDGNEEIFVTLTPAQAKSLSKKVDEGIELNQNLFIAYKYESEDYGSQIGIGIKKAMKPAKDFDDFNTSDEEEEIEEEVVEE